jgi:hypothetical protein
MKYFFDQPNLISRQTRWLELLFEYDFDIKHIKGKEKKVANALNIRVHELHAMTISMYQTNIKGGIFKDANADLQYMELVTKIQQGKMIQKVEDYKLEDDGTLLFKNIIYAPNLQELRIMIMKEMHNVSYVGNPGYQKIVE